MARAQVKWQSKVFPKLTLSEDHYELMRRTYRHIESFQREMERLEAWLYANPARVPKRNWKNQINGWMRIADEIAEREKRRRLTLGKERPRTHREAAESIGEIFKRLAEDSAREPKTPSADGALFDGRGRIAERNP